MSKNTWILWGLLLMIPGVLGLGCHFAQQKALHGRIAQAVEATAKNPATQEYLDMYEKWFSLSPAAKAENPWGQDPYGGPEIQKRLSEGQSDRLLADIADLDKGVKRFPEELAETLYGSGWEQQLEDYHRRCSKLEILLIAAVFLLASSGLILLGGTAKVLVSYGLSKFKSTEDVLPQEQPKAPNAVSDEESPDLIQPQLTGTEEAEGVPLAQTQPASDMEKVIAANRADKGKKDSADDNDTVGYFESRKKGTQNPSPTNSEPSDANKSSLSELSKPASPRFFARDKITKDSYFGWALNEEKSSDMESPATAEPLTKELTELTEEVSAIRQFAAQQQDQVRKLQDGYDWIIIRRFCLRIIRSIDNIEDQIARLNDPESELTICLQDIRDELVFSLESSGIEQFSPELKAPFKGLEKYAEAVRPRVPTGDESLCGCIAEIIRPGYQYLISDDDVKIVRCAQVKLYETQ